MKPTKTSLSDQVAAEIQARIRSSQYKIGDKLPTEKILAEEFSVSRLTIREAVSKLKTMDILEVRQGDGTFVKSLTPASFMKPLLSMLTLDKTRMHDIFEIRLLLECKAVELAANQATPKEIESVQYYLEQMEFCVMNNNLERYNELDRLFHYEIIRCSHNKIMAAIYDMLMSMIKDSIIATTSPPNAVANSILYHSKITAAIIAHKPIEASSFMKKHLEGGANYIESSI